MTPRQIFDLRTRRLNERRIVTRGRDYVLCCLRQALRAEENPALDAAIALANRRELPVVVLHALENRYPHASHRLHRFALEASQDLERGVEARGLRFVRWVRRAGEHDVRLIERLSQRAAAVVIDDVPTFAPARWAASFARRLDRALLAVDACCAVPMNAFPEPLGTTKAFRAAFGKLRDTHLETDLRQEPVAPRYEGELAVESEPLDDTTQLERLIVESGVDRSVPPAPGFSGHRSAALERLAFSVREVLPRYKWTRNNPALPDGSTRLSPWLHFGVLSPREVANAALAAEAAGELHPAARWKFLDELLTWREVYHHRCRHEPLWTRWEGLPAWGRETLADHADDPRPELPPDDRRLDVLIHGETPDETWNAAQKQFLYEGWMNNNLRMYWVVQIHRWCASPQEAWATACYLNDRFSLDGRDANTYGGIRWAFGDARPSSRELPIYGRITRKTSAALRKRDGVAEWLATEAAREDYRVDVPDDPSSELARYL